MDDESIRVYMHHKAYIWRHEGLLAIEAIPSIGCRRRASSRTVGEVSNGPVGAIKGTRPTLSENAKKQQRGASDSPHTKGPSPEKQQHAHFVSSIPQVLTWTTLPSVSTVDSQLSHDKIIYLTEETVLRAARHTQSHTQSHIPMAKSSSLCSMVASK